MSDDANTPAVAEASAPTGDHEPPSEEQSPESAPAQETDNDFGAGLL